MYALPRFIRCCKPSPGANSCKALFNIQHHGQAQKPNTCSGKSREGTESPERNGKKRVEDEMTDVKKET